jgi:hypothetical protein
MLPACRADADVTAGKKSRERLRKNRRKKKEERKRHGPPIAHGHPARMMNGTFPFSEMFVMKGF